MLTDDSQRVAFAADRNEMTSPSIPSRRGRKPRSPNEVDAVVVNTMRRGKHAAGEEQEPESDRQFVVALARGLGVLAAFQAKDSPLGNMELSERTGIPAATISRVTHTLTKLGYLTFDQRRETYDLGGSSLALGHTALARISMRRVALPLMQQLADSANANVGLGVRDRTMMLYADTCEGSGLVGLRLYPGSRIPISTSAMGRAYLSTLGNEERQALLDEVTEGLPAQQRDAIFCGMDTALRSIEDRGFCTSFGEWHRDINGVAVPITDPVRSTTYVLNLGGPGYVLSERELLETLGPRLVEVRNEIIRTLRPD